MTRQRRIRPRIRQYNQNYYRPTLLVHGPSIRQARIDKLVIHIPDIEVRFDNADAARGYLLRLSSTDYFRSSHSDNLFFNIDPEDRYHFGGSLSFRRESDVRYSATFKLHLNPTRFIAHNGCNHERFRTQSFEDIFLKSLRQARLIRELTLDNKDNFLRDPYFEQTCHNSFEIYHLYIGRVLQRLENALRASGPLRRIGVARISRVRPPANTVGELDFSLERVQVRQIEAYWDMAHADAIAAFHDTVKPVIRQGAYRYSEHDYVSPACEEEEVNEEESPDNVCRYSEERYGNSPSLILRYGDNPQRRRVELSIYPKTTNVIRFEYRYYRSIASYVNRNNYEISAPFRHAYEEGGLRSWDESTNIHIPDMRDINLLIDKALHDAHSRLLPVLRAIGRSVREQSTVPVHTLEILRVVKEFYQHLHRACVGNNRHMQVFLCMLTPDGRISYHEDHRIGEFTQSFLRLKEDTPLLERVRLVESERGSRQYILAPRYRYILPLLTESHNTPNNS